MLFFVFSSLFEVVFSTFVDGTSGSGAGVAGVVSFSVFGVSVLGVDTSGISSIFSIVLSGTDSISFTVVVPLPSPFFALSPVIEFSETAVVFC